MNIPENFDRWMFDYNEGNLSGAEMEAFENFIIQNPEFEVDADAWNHAFISNEDIAYPKQAELEKDRKVGIIGWSTAAMLLLLVGIGTFFIINPQSSSINGYTTSKLSINPDNASNHIANHEINDLSESKGALPLEYSNNSIASNSSIQNEFNSNNYSIINSSIDENNESNAHNVSNEDISSIPTEYFAFNGSPNKVAIEQELEKFTEGDYISTYQTNPSQNELGFDVNKKKSDFKYNSFARTLKQFYKKIERMLEYPVGLTHLRDPEIGIPNFAVLSTNPGFVGGMLTPRFEMNYRNQWLGSELNSQQLNLSFDTYSYDMRGGVGVMINAVDYNNGAYGDYNASLLYSPKFVINRNIVFEPAIKMTLGMMTANGNKLEPNSAFEINRSRPINTLSQSEMSGRTQLWYKDYGLGFMINTKWFYMGFSADNLANHFESLYSNDLSDPSRTPTQLTAIAGFDYESQNSRGSNKINRSISPYVVYQKFGTRNELWAGTNLRYDWFTIGGSYSTGNEYTASIGFHFPKFKLIYRYDMTESLLMGDKVASHNIGIRFNAKRKTTRIR